MKKIVCINLDKDLIKIIDKERGDVNRSLYLNKILKKYYEGKHNKITINGMKGGLKKWIKN